MSYKVGEVAEIMGLSKQGVRFFERNGYLNGHRLDNRYRVYERRDLTIAQQIQGYASVGFTLKEAADLVLSSDLDSIESQLELCDARIDAMISRLQSQREALALRRQVVERVKQNRPVVIHYDEEWLFLPVEGEGALPNTHRLECEWMSKYPMTMLAKVPVLADGTASDSRGICVSAGDARRLRLTVPEGVIRFPAGYYWNAVISKPVGESKDYFNMYREAEACHPTGPMLSIVEISFVQNGVRSTVSQVRLPVENP